MSLNIKSLNRQDIVFVLDNIQGYQSIIDGIDKNATVVILGSDKNAIEQMASLLDGLDDIDSIHLISHGFEGGVNLGSISLTNDNLNDYSDTLAKIGSALKEDGDFLLYGCNSAKREDGRLFVDTLAKITKADVAASDDLTGNSVFGGDNVLEYASGAIESVGLNIDWNKIQTVLVTTTFSGDAPNINNVDATVSGGSKNNLSITSSGETLLIASAGTGTMWQDTAANLSDAPTGMSGIYIKTDFSTYWTTSLTLTIQGGKLFDFKTIALQEANGSSDTFKFIPNNNAGLVVTSSYADVEFKTIDLSANTDFQNLTSLTITTNDAKFQANFDTIVLDNIHLPAPTVTLTASSASIAEAAGTSTITATLSSTASTATTITIAATGTATGSGTDYALSSTTITIAAGQTTGTATITAAQETR